MHGSTMMFLFAVPMMFEALSVYLVPLMVGTRNIAFPRLNAYSYYLYVMGGIMFYVAFLCNTGADRGWFAYVPLSGPDSGPGKRPDFWAQLVTFTEVSALAVAVEVIVTVFRFRAPGMSLNRLPIFVWGQLVVAFMVLFSLPGVVLCSTMLLLDRTCGTQFFNPAAGGDVLLYQHLFWWFGHPEVYLIFLPGTAIVSTIVTAFSRRHIFGYLVLVPSLVGTAFLAFGLWVHHMFATGIPQIRGELLHCGKHGDRHPLRSSDLLLDRDSCDRTARAEDASLVGDRLLLHLHYGRRCCWRSTRRFTNSVSSSSPRTCCSTRSWYPAYTTTMLRWGLTPLEDQQLGGVIMWVPSAVTFLVIALALMTKWLAESDRRVQFGSVETLLRQQEEHG